MNSIKEVNFGYADAITEAERSPENFSLSFFDPHEYLQELVQGTRFIVCGKKGDGKSAFGAKLRLMEETTNYKTYLRTLNNFNNLIFEKIQSYEKLGGNPYISFWKCVLMIETIKMLNKHDPYIQEENYLQIFDALNRKGFLDLDIDISMTISKLVESDTSFRIKYFFKQGKKKEYTEELKGSEQIYCAISNAIKTLYLKNSYFLIIDGLDDILSSTEFKSEIITGLLRASNEINSYFMRQTLNLKIIILIRTDIMDICRDPNLSKLKRDSAINLSWRVGENPFSSDLFLLVQKRFEVALKRKIDLEEMWEEIFPASINEKRSVEYVLENLIYRPRDILQLFIEVQRECEHGERLSEDQLQSVLYSFSDYFLGAMLDDLTGFFPNEAVTSLPDVLSKLGNQYFYPKDFYNVCSQYKVFDGIVLSDILNKLFLDGYIGQHRPRDMREKDYTVFKFRNSREKFQEDHECIIHRGLQRALTI